MVLSILGNWHIERPIDGGRTGTEAIDSNEIDNRNLGRQGLKTRLHAYMSM